MNKAEDESAVVVLDVVPEEEEEQITFADSSELDGKVLSDPHIVSFYDYLKSDEGVIFYSHEKAWSILRKKTDIMFHLDVDHFGPHEYSSMKSNYILAKHVLEEIMDSNGMVKKEALLELEKVAMDVTEEGIQTLKGILMEDYEIFANAISLESNPHVEKYLLRLSIKKKEDLYNLVVTVEILKLLQYLQSKTKEYNEFIEFFLMHANNQILSITESVDEENVSITVSGSAATLNEYLMDLPVVIAYDDKLIVQTPDVSFVVEKLLVPFDEELTQMFPGIEAKYTQLELDLAKFGVPFHKEQFKSIFKMGKYGAQNFTRFLREARLEEARLKPNSFMDAFIAVATPIHQLLLRENLYPAFINYSVVYYSTGWLLIQFESLWYFLQLSQSTGKLPRVPVTAKIQFSTLQVFFGFNNEVKSLYETFGAHYAKDVGDAYVYSHSFFATNFQFIEFDAGTYIPDPAGPRVLVENAKDIIEQLERIFPAIHRTAPLIWEKDPVKIIDPSVVDKHISPRDDHERYHNFSPSLPEDLWEEKDVHPVDKDEEPFSQKIIYEIESSEDEVDHNSETEQNHWPAEKIICEIEPSEEEQSSCITDPADLEGF